MTLAQLHHDPDLPRLAAVLVLVVLVQALLPLQAHTRVVRTADGIARQVCTLSGAPAADPQPFERDSPAMVFSQLAAELLPAAAAPAPVAYSMAAAATAAEPPGTPPPATAAAARIRAPPPA